MRMSIFNVTNYLITFKNVQQKFKVHEVNSKSRHRECYVRMSNFDVPEVLVTCQKFPTCSRIESSTPINREKCVV